MLYLIVAILVCVVAYAMLRCSDVARQNVYRFILFCVFGVLCILLLRAGLPLLAAVLSGVVAVLPYYGRIMQFMGLMSLFKRFWYKGKVGKENKVSNGMSVEQARDVLGVKDGASAKEIKKAYHDLMKKNHPDTGGSKYFASQLNVAKDVLLKTDV